MSAEASNPLLVGEGLPDFAGVRPEHVAPAVDRLLADADAALEAAVGAGVPAEYRALARVLDVPVERLGRVWGTVVHLQSVVDTPELRAAYGEALPRVTAFYTRLGSDQRLYAKYKFVAASPGAAALTTAERKALDNALRDFVLGGAELEGAARERHAQILSRAAELSQHFGEHVLDATDAYSLHVDEDRLAGVPDHVRRAARDAAAAEGRSGCKLSLHAPCVWPVLQYCDDRPVREALYRALHTRASELGPSALDNGPLMRELLELRSELAGLLGHASYAELSLVPKMAKTPAQVNAFVRDAAARAGAVARADDADLRRFAATTLGLPQLQPWDRAWASEKLRQQRFAFSGTEVQAYLTEPKVLEGLFRLVERLFDIAIHPAPMPLWHADARHFVVERAGQTIASFTLDLYARAGKQQGAWMDEARKRWRRPDGGALQLPLAHLVCNFAPPTGGKPSLLTHSDLITLFHEFGHGLHHMLTQVDELAVSGIAGVEWDAAELPSQFMENFCWEWEVLQALTAHADTGEPLPRDLFDRMVAARHFHSALRLLRNCEYSLFDMRLHAEPATAGRVMQLAEEVNREIAVVPQPEFMRYPHTFGHLFDGGYAAGYYGYAWAEVLSADAYSAFEESGVFDAATGRRFREAILEAGGSRSALENFVAFRGREPRIDAWLRHQGIA